MSPGELVPGSAFPVARVGALLGLDDSAASAALADDESARRAVARAMREFLAADDDRRAGRPPSSSIALHPDFPTGTAMALVGAGLLWSERTHVPVIALRAATDLHRDGRHELAASYAALVQSTAQPTEHDAQAWAAQSLLVSILQSLGEASSADVLARDLAAHGVPIDLWREADPQLPDESLTWHGGALVAGMGPRPDGRPLSVEDAERHLQDLLRRTLREVEAENEGAVDEGTGDEGTGDEGEGGVGAGDPEA